MKAIEEFIEALKIGETLKERLQTVKQEQGASWQGSEDYSDAISYVGELAEHKWEAEEEKVVEALTQYLQDTIGEYSNGRVDIEFKG